MSTKTISAYRVIETLEEKHSDTVPPGYVLLVRKKCFIDKFYIVSSDWREQLKFKQEVDVLAECAISKDAKEVSLKSYREGILPTQDAAFFQYPPVHGTVNSIAY